MVKSLRILFPETAAGGAATATPPPPAADMTAK